MNDILIFNDENFLSQLTAVEYVGGRYKLQFYSENGRPASIPTEVVDTFYFYPSGGTIRDKEYNIIEYFPKYDTYRGFKPPHMLEKK